MSRGEFTAAEWTDFKRRILAFVKSAKTYRGEVAICQRFGKQDPHAPTEDALHELVREKKLEWFGNHDGPLRYRVRGAR